MNAVEMIVNFLLRNLWWIVPSVIVVFVVYQYFKIGRKIKLKPLDRSEVERLKFIERMKHNKTSVYKWFKRGDVILGKIDYARKFEVTVGNPEKTLDVTQLVVKPYLLSIGRFRFTNPFSKYQCFQIASNQINKDIGDRTLFIEDWLHFDYYFGIYYDASQERDHTKIIKEDNVIRTDLNELASIYFVKSQEQSTFDPDHAHRLALEEKKLQVELAKKKGKSETI